MKTIIILFISVTFSSDVLHQQILEKIEKFECDMSKVEEGRDQIEDALLLQTKEELTQFRTSFEILRSVDSEELISDCSRNIHVLVSSMRENLQLILMSKSSTFDTLEEILEDSCYLQSGRDLMSSWIDLVKKIHFNDSSDSDESSDSDSSSYSSSNSDKSGPEISSELTPELPVGFFPKNLIDQIHSLIRDNHLLGLEIEFKQHPGLINAIDPNQNFTPLMKAAFYGAKESLNFLISAGARINFRSSDNMTALSAGMLALDNPVEIIKILVKAGAKTDGLFTPKNHSLSTMAENIDNLELKEFWKNIKDPQSLILEIEKDNFGTILEYINFGADPHQENEDGITPYVVALSLENQRVIRLFNKK